ncbi:G-protein coupled receptor 52-like [Tubulanus polymorphus]|uniref:G-protein coupled receptor 52-like n=1 Tax=Tubulanus polymorphus TaxID=672921 RepID=UPI003DA30CD8
MNVTTNSTQETVDGSYVHPIPSVFRVIFTSFVTFAIIVSNIINLTCMRHLKQLPKTSRLCLLNLSCADIMVGLFACLPSIYPSCIDKWPYSIDFCQVSGMFHGVSVTVSIWSLGLVSIDRHLAITRPYRYGQLVTPCRLYIVFGGLWLGASITFMTPILQSLPESYYKYSHAENMCAMYWIDNFWYCLITGIYIPIFSGLILMSTSCHIAKIARNQVRRIQNLEVIEHEGKVSKSDMRAIRVLGTTAIAYFLSWGTYTAVAVVSSGDVRVPDVISWIATWIANCNSFMNVIIYSYVNRMYRKMVWRLLVSVISCKIRMLTTEGIRRIGDDISDEMSNNREMVEIG